MASLRDKLHGIVLMVIFLNCTCVHGTNYSLSDFCGRTLDMKQRNLNEVVLKLTKHRSYWSNVKCDVTIMTSPGSHLSFRILEMVLDDCGDTVSLYGDSTNSSDTLYAHMCSTPSHAYGFKTPGSKGIVTFTSNTHGNVGGFKILITSFYNTLNDTCDPGYFKCNNRRCIKSRLHCNRRDNCGDNSDEPGKCRRDASDEEENRWWIPLVCIAGGIFFMCCICHLKKKHDMKVKARAAANAQKNKKAPAKSDNTAPKQNQQSPQQPKTKQASASGGTQDKEKTQGGAKQEGAKTVTESPKQADTPNATSSGATQGDSKPPKVKDTEDKAKPQAAPASGASSSLSTSTHAGSSSASSVPLVEAITHQQVPPMTNTTSEPTGNPATSQPLSAVQMPQNVPPSAMQMITPMYVHVIPVSQPYIHASQSSGLPRETPPSYFTAMSAPPPPMSAWADSFPPQALNPIPLAYRQQGDFVVNLPPMEPADSKPPSYTPESSNRKY